MRAKRLHNSKEPLVSARDYSTLQHSLGQLLTLSMREGKRIGPSRETAAYFEAKPAIRGKNMK